DPMYGEYRKVPIVVAEYVNGQSLGDLLEHKMFQDLKPKVAFSRLATLLIIEQIVMGLCACHHVGVIHRDIKPDNCIVIQDVIDSLVEAYRKNWGLNMSEIELILMEHRAKGKAWIKISDLGSALIAEPKGDDFTFSVKKFIPGGSPAYMAPESVRDEVSGRTDIFALGMTLYQLLTGRNPREARQVAEGINALKYQSSYVYLEDLRKAEATHAVDIETDPGFDHMRAESGQYEDNKEILNLLRQMTVRDRRSRIRTTACLSTIRALVNAELKEKHIEKFITEMEAKDAQIKQLEEENKGIKKYYSVQLKNYQSKVKMAQALEENLENELGRRDDELKALKKEKRESQKEVERSNRHLKGLAAKKERLEETVRLVRKELERVERKLADRERSFSKSEDTIAELHQALSSLRAKNAEAQKILTEKQGYARSMSEKVEQLQELVGDLGNLNYFMQISESLSLFPNLEDSVALSIDSAPKEPMDPSSTTFKRSTEDRIALVFQNLTGDSLVLSELDFDSDQISQLKETPELSRIRKLTFEGRPLSSDFLDLLIRSSHLTGLKVLELRECKVSVKTMKKLMGSSNIMGLESFALEETELATDAIKLLARAQDWTGLKSLSLARNTLGAEGVKLLSKASCLKTLEELNLESNGLHKDDVEVLLSSKKGLKQLRALNLNDNHIGPDGCEVLAQSETLKSLSKLNLDGNQIGAAGAEHIIQSQFLKKLDTLYLEHNELGVEGAKILASAEDHAQLKHLTLGANALGDDGVSALAESQFFKDLEHLDLGANTIGAEGALSLAACVALDNLKTLNLNLNSIREKGVQALANAESLENLETLNLYLNQINDAGLEALVGSSSIQSLKSLDVGANGITDKGAETLIDSRFLEQIDDLVLFSNSISEELVNQIEQTIKERQKAQAEPAGVIENGAV
ncbi:MAG: protein kinase, partial [Planctomycetota bacterium]|nr:protein kinase [Planctomycetota bacterium]